MRSGRSSGLILFSLAVLLAGSALAVAWFWQSPSDQSAPSVTAQQQLPASQTQETGESVATPPEAPTEPATSPTASAPETAPVVAKSADDQFREKLVGFWLHQESGEHWIENRPDGTARMLLKLDFVASLLYGQQTTMELSWEVKDGVLSHTVVSGTPQANVDSLVKAFGKTRNYTILETTDERMLLKPNTDVNKKDLWTRTPPPKEWMTTPEKEGDGPSPRE